MAENFDLIFGSSASQSYSWNDSDYQNGWQTVGDTPPTREQFDALQRRADLKARELNNRLAPIEENDTHDYRQPSTAYTAGAIKYHATLPTGWYLECTTDGTTGAGALVITSPSVGGTVTDGTVVWTIMKNISVMGGKLYAGDDNACQLTLDNTAGRITLRADPSTTNGGGMSLFGTDYSSDRFKGSVYMLAKNAVDGYADLRLHPNGALYYSNADTNENVIVSGDLAGSAIVAKSLGQSGYVKYASKFIIQWGGASPVVPAGKDITFPISFKSGTSYRLFVGINRSSADSTARSVWSGNLTASGATIYTNTGEIGVHWFAIGHD